MNDTTAEIIRTAMKNRGFREAFMPKPELVRLEFLRDFQKGPPSEDRRNDLCMTARELSDAHKLNVKVAALTIPNNPRVTNMDFNDEINLAAGMYNEETSGDPIIGDETDEEDAQ